jgi:hypothetical protein
MMPKVWTFGAVCGREPFTVQESQGVATHPDRDLYAGRAPRTQRSVHVGEPIPAAVPLVSLSSGMERSDGPKQNAGMEIDLPGDMW